MKKSEKEDIVIYGEDRVVVKYIRKEKQGMSVVSFLDLDNLEYLWYTKRNTSELERIKRLGVGSTLVIGYRVGETEQDKLVIKNVKVRG